MVTVLDVIKDLAIAIPTIMVGTQAITAAIHGIFKIENDNINHAISWIVAILAAIGFVAFNGLNFGFEKVWVNYLLGGLCGLVVGGMSNGFYDWPHIKSLFDAITEFFANIRRKITEKK